MKKIILASYLFFLCACSGSRNEEFKLIPIKSNNKWGFVDLQGKYLINPQFSEVFPFSCGASLIRNSEGKYGFIDEEGKFIINPTYKEASPFYEDLACTVLDEGKPTYIDKNGEIKFVVDCDEAGNFIEGFAIIRIKEKWGFINKEGKIAIPATFDRVSFFSEGLAPIMLRSETSSDNSWGYIDITGKIVINPQFSSAGTFKDGIALVNNGKQYGYIDKEGKYLINPQFDYASNFENGLAAISQGNSYGYINKEGKIVINPQFNNALPFSNNQIAVIKSGDNKWGYIDSEGKFKINPQFDWATPFYNKIAFVRVAGKWGFIDEEGKYLVNPQFEEIVIPTIDNGRNRIIESDYSNVHIVGKWRFFEMQNPQMDRMMNETRAKINSTTNNSEREQMENSLKMMQDALENMKVNSFIEFMKDGRYNSSMGGQNDYGTWAVNSEGTSLTTTDSKGKSDELMIDENSAERLVLSSVKDSMKIIFKADDSVIK